jgi:DNA-binding transcriptional MerR regulator
MQRFSGISVHTIRAWEKRYHGLKPDRSEGNTRYYSGNQLRRLLNIASLMNYDYKVSELCSMSDSKLHEQLRKVLENETIKNEMSDLLISQVVSAAILFDEILFEKIFSKAIVAYGMEGAYLNVIYPALKRIGLMWATDSVAPAQEHFLSNLLRQKLYASIDILPLNNNSKKHWALFLPENEFHELGLLMANYLIRSAGHRCTYLGSNLPIESLSGAVKSIKPENLLLFLVSKNDEDADKDLIKQIVKTFPSQKIYVAAEPERLQKLKEHKNLIQISSRQQLKKELKTV